MKNTTVLYIYIYSELKFSLCAFLSIFFLIAKVFQKAKVTHVSVPDNQCCLIVVSRSSLEFDGEWMANSS